jgi:hypothetical protein
MAIPSTNGERLSSSLALVLGLATGLLYFLLARGMNPDGATLAAGLFGLLSGVVTTGIAWATGRVRLPKPQFHLPIDPIGD